RDANVRFGSLADIEALPLNVRFTPKSRHWNSVCECPLCAKSGHQARPFDSRSLVQGHLNMRGCQIGIAGTFLQEQRSENSCCRAEHHIKSRRYRYAGRLDQPGHEKRRKTSKYHNGYIVSRTEPRRTDVCLKLFG